MRYVTTEFEPVFDAVDFVRCGRDIFVQRSHVTNKSGIEWLRRYLGNEYRIHEVKTKTRQACHIDTTFMPKAPGKLLYNPKFIDSVYFLHRARRTGTTDGASSSRSGCKTDRPDCSTFATFSRVHCLTVSNLEGGRSLSTSRCSDSTTTASLSA